MADTRTRKALLGAVVALALTGATLAVAGASGLFDDDAAEVREVAERYAAALSGGDSDSLAKVTCLAPSAEQAETFETRAGSSTVRWSVLRQPEVGDDYARGTLRARDGDAHRDYPFTLHKHDDTWCAHYDWSQLDKDP